MTGFDVVVVGEILVELYCDDELADGASLRLGFSGDAMNSAAAAAAAGANTAVLTAISTDEIGDAIINRLTELNIDPTLIRRDRRPNGAYLVHGDLTGHRQFTYWRNESAASTLDERDIGQHFTTLSKTGALVLSGITAALSDSAERAILTAARIPGTSVIYDPNFRPKLTTPQRARTVLADVARYCTLITPSCPGDSLPLLNTDDPGETATAGLHLGARSVAVTSGATEVLIAGAADRFRLPVPAIPNAVDATGAGDVFTGTTAACLAMGDPLHEAVRLAIGAASLSVTGRGGTGHIPTLTDTRAAAPPQP
ncbi:MAG TPA: sugar kinase [Pseudonocardiaceae bacterium]|jgi:2-dehydro-3-deoxygluconokinase|nr:sugar kinase [Pseudonocardiaceae bacterium]